MRYLITGHAGFIGSALSNLLVLNKKDTVIGLDNFNKYYDVSLKKKRVQIIKEKSGKKNFKSINCDLRNKTKLKKIFSKYKFDVVINLAAQAGIRYSLKKPEEYITTNINGFFNLIDLSKKYKIKKFIYASSSSVYGNSKNKISKETDLTNKPLQIYAATKISNELIAHAYSHLYNLKTIGLRFFTVYGPWGRPDMAIFKFTKNILKKKNINLYNFGKNQRDYTYIDDVAKCIKNICKSKKYKNLNYQILNIGNNKPVKTLKMVKILEKNLNKKANKKLTDNFIADSFKTAANNNLIKKRYGLNVKTPITIGLKHFVQWYKSFFKVKY